MSRRRTIKWRNGIINTDAILAADGEVWSENIVALTECLLRFIDAENVGAPGNAVWAVQDDIERIARVLFPDHYRRLDEADAERERLRIGLRGAGKKPVPRDLRKRVFERDGFRCLRCGSQWDLCADHIHPESRGGPTTLDNLQTLCRTCNSRKNDRVESDGDPR